MKICVVGAGIIGLSAAYRLQTESNGKHRVTVISKEFTPNTTSDVAGGLIELFDYFGSNPTNSRKWFIETYKYTLDLALSSQAMQAGVSCIRLSNFGKLNILRELLKENPDEGRRLDNLTDEEVEHYNKTGAGFPYFTSSCEGRLHLPWLTKRFAKAGGLIRQAEVRSMKELFGEFDIVVNCTGVGARELANDDTVYPIKGQLVKVKAPWLFKTRFVRKDGRSYYIVPGFETAALGGSFETGNESKFVDPAFNKATLAGCSQLEPSIMHAEVKETVAGWRPARTEGIRLEKEFIKMENGTSRMVVHNYGHAGIGWTTHWGCAGDVLQIVNQEMGVSKL